jgi:hypothetical protein
VAALAAAAGGAQGRGRRCRDREGSARVGDVARMRRQQRYSAALTRTPRRNAAA